MIARLRASISGLLDSVGFVIVVTSGSLRRNSGSLFGRFNRIKALTGSVVIILRWRQNLKKLRSAETLRRIDVVERFF